MWNSMVFRVRAQRVAWPLLLCLLAMSPCRAMAGTSLLRLSEAPGSGVLEQPQQLEQIAQYLAVLGTIITLIGGAMSVLPKVSESISLRSRRKRELDRVESLAELMAKIKSEDVLTETMRSNVGAQIEAEIADALEGLQVNRMRRQRAHKARTYREQPDLTFAERAFLWYQPHGFRAWLAHTLAFSLSAAGLLLVLMDVAVADTLANELPFIGSILACVILWWIPFRAWALHERRKWRAAHPLPPLIGEQVAAAA